MPDRASEAFRFEHTALFDAVIETFLSKVFRLCPEISWFKRTARKPRLRCYL